MTASAQDSSGKGKHPGGSVNRIVTVIRYAAGLTWEASPRLAIAITCITLAQGLYPALIAWVGAALVDVIAAKRNDSITPALTLAALEAGLVIAALATAHQRSFVERLLQLRLSWSVETSILRKTVSLNLSDFENSEFYNRLTLARQEAGTRPLTIVQRLADLARDFITLVSATVLLAGFAPWAFPVLVVAALPGFLVEARLADNDHAHVRAHIGNLRMQAYIQTVLGREDHAREVKLFGLGQPFLGRFERLHDHVSREARSLAAQRLVATLLTGSLSTLALYGSYGLSVAAAATGTISLGDMTMSMLLYRQCQSAVISTLSRIGQLHADKLYLSNLIDFLRSRSKESLGSATTPLTPGDGLRAENVSFRYPGAQVDALREISFHLPPGMLMGIAGQNGSGKTTLIKLLTGLYRPTSGRILLDGRDLHDWNPDVLRSRFSVMFQDFTRYQFTLGENIGVGDADHMHNRERWLAAASGAGIRNTIDSLPNGMETQLGRWFDNGVDLSGGQWQGVAASRAWMRCDADIVVLDEPTSAMDALAEAELLSRVYHLLTHRTGIVISHHLATLRRADIILVLHQGLVQEAGSHDRLIAANGHYARLFELQSSGYR